jgi:hypothetical protein
MKMGDENEIGIWDKIKKRPRNFVASFYFEFD